MTADRFCISPDFADEIEDAILFGRPNDLKAILERIEGTGNFPDEILYGLQSLYFFRVHYNDEPLNESNRKKADLMESAWAMELFNKVRARVEPPARRAGGLPR